MKKTYILLITISLWSNIKSQNNNQSNYVSELFNYSLSKNIQANLDPKSHNNIYTTYDSALFVVNQKGFEYQNAEGYAKISKINIFTGLEENFFISLPPAFIENGGKIERIWIWDIAANDSLLCLAVDEGIWVYRYSVSKQYEFIKTISVKNIVTLEIVNNNLHAFIENNDGYDWIKINFSNNEIDTIRQLVLTNPFFLQIAPVKIISIKNNALYFLQRNEPAIEKYSLTGEWLASYYLKIPEWNNIPDNITQKLDSIEDTTERNYAFSKFSVFDNNFMHLFYAFSCERFFMIAIDRKPKAETYITPYFVQIIGDSTVIETLSVKLNENEKFGEKYFPFLTASAEGNVVFAQSNEYITQINKSSNVTWQNKTQKEYNHEIDMFYKDYDPIEKIETYQWVKNLTHIDSIQFLDYDNHIFALNDIKTEKAIFIISQYPQCSTCIKIIWNYFSKKNLNEVNIYNVSQNCLTYLEKKENIKEVDLYLKTEYTPLFINTNELNTTTKQLLSQKENPIIVLFDKKLQHIEIITTTHIVGDLMGNLKPSFIHTIDNFIGN